MKIFQKVRIANLRKIIILLIADVLFIQLASLLAISIRFDFHWIEIPEHFMESIASYVMINTICTIAVFWLFRLYHSVWHYASSSELVSILGATGTSAIMQAIGMYLLAYPIPRSYAIFYFAFLTLFIFVPLASDRIY